MTKIHVVLAGGSCGNTLYLIEDQLKESFQEWGFEVRLTTQSIWEHFHLPEGVRLVLQTLPAYKEDEIDCPVLSVRPMIPYRQDPATLKKIKDLLLNIDARVQPGPEQALALGEQNG
jgi:hypothetical protein